ncbi:MAG: tetratricopeptide repeat protein [Elusimicrobia bacterium]|nr:tetratricopeptide repeat protein [Elusimicrobiota bacterium]
MPPASRGAERWLFPALIVAAVCAAFAPALGNGFVDWDDVSHIVENKHLRGLTLENLRWMLSEEFSGNWHPLTWLSLALSHAAGGVEPSGYHLADLCLHAASALLLFAAGRRLLSRAGLADERADWGAALAALFWAVHPLRVESVAWATERKDTLSGFFLLASLWARLRAVGADRPRAWEAASVACYGLSLLSKVTGISFPGALLVLEVYPLRRLSLEPRRWLGREERARLLSLAPYAALALLVFFHALATAELRAAAQTIPSPSAVARLNHVLYSVFFYPWKTLAPASLSPFYAIPAWFARFTWKTAGFLAAAAGAILLVREARRRPWAAAVAAAYLALLVPVSGLIAYGTPIRAADRYSYFPSLAIALLFGAAFARGPAARALAGAWILALVVAARAQCAVWRDTLSLWTAAAGRDPSGFARSNKGVSLARTGRLEDGLEELRRTVEAHPRVAVAWDNYGVTLMRAGRRAEAVRAWRRGLELEGLPELHAHLGSTLAGDASRAELERGIGHLRTALTLNPGEAGWRTDLAQALLRTGDAATADAEFAAAAAADPSLGRAKTNRGLSLAAAGRLAEAAEQYRLALYCGDSRAETHYDWGNLLLAQGRLDDAERHYRESLRLDPSLARAHVNLGNVLARRGRFADAAARYATALTKDPGLAEARVNLAAVRRAMSK